MFLADISEKAAKRLQGLRNSSITLHNNTWINPPIDIVSQGLERVVRYWEAISLSGSTQSWKLKVVLVGAVKAGKTSLVNGMIHGKPHLCPEEDRTKGVDVHVTEPCQLDAERSLELTFWDFAGHNEYYYMHQVFLSKGALHLLVVDIKRFCDEPSARSELVNVWLDALQCRVPGSSVLIIATQSDRLNGDLELALKDLRRTVEIHPGIKRDKLDQTRPDKSTTLGAQQGLILHGIEAVSSAHSDSLLDLRLKLSMLVNTEQDLFPSVGQRCPVSWARAFAMLEAKRLGKDPILEASRVGTFEQDHNETRETTADGVKFLHRVDAIDEWLRLVQTLNLKNEIGSTAWDVVLRPFTGGKHDEQKGKDVFEVCTEQNSAFTL